MPRVRARRARCSISGVWWWRRASPRWRTGRYGRNDPRAKASRQRSSASFREAHHAGPHLHGEGARQRPGHSDAGGRAPHAPGDGRVLVQARRPRGTPRRSNTLLPCSLLHDANNFQYFREIRIGSESHRRREVSGGGRGKCCHAGRGKQKRKRTFRRHRRKNAPPRETKARVDDQPGGAWTTEVLFRNGRCCARLVVLVVCCGEGAKAHVCKHTTPTVGCDWFEEPSSGSALAKRLVPALLAFALLLAFRSTVQAV